MIGPIPDQERAHQEIEKLAQEARGYKAFGGKTPAGLPSIRERKLRKALFALNVASYR